MDLDEIYRKLKELVPEESRLLRNADMRDYTTFRIGGPADFLVRPASEKEMAGILGCLRGNHIPYTVMGNGSNVLVLDGRHPGCRHPRGKRHGGDFRRKRLRDGRSRSTPFRRLIRCGIRRSYRDGICGGNSRKCGRSRLYECGSLRRRDESDSRLLPCSPARRDNPGVRQRRDEAGLSPQRFLRRTEVSSCPVRCGWRRAGRRRSWRV